MQNVKGTNDYFGKEQALRKKVQNTLQELFELYDFDGMDTTLLNELELMTSKYAGGDEIVKEMYQLKDQGQRNLALRYDLTIPFAKVIALNPGLPFPYKRYEIGKVFRDGPTKRGRLREFVQCDVDVVGIAGPAAEAELMQLAADVFGKLDIPIVLKWNNRRFLGEVLEALGVPHFEKQSVMLTLDKIAKVSSDGIRAELIDKGLNAAITTAILELIAIRDLTFDKLTDKYGLKESVGAQEVLALQNLITSIGLEDICQFDPFLSRGLSFYTGTVYEIFDATYSFTSSLGGGGRYDSIIGQLVNRDDIEYPTVGLSFGMESIMAMLENRSTGVPPSPVVIVPIGDTITAALRAAAQLRNCGIRTSVDSGGRKLRKLLASLSSKGIRNIIFIGEDEQANAQVRWKDMTQKTEKVLTIQEAITLITEQSQLLREV
ncbi:histidine--tRNA ligase 1 [Paenibacillus baekrokdamisoli]|uniref:Histidine--tRNA ligase n=1 Tax=Paenibacillus baekrokdamisoli TaxID=1712516 RepID=A0A3G9IQE5_9BACL|nr:histidine--tRNA ligase [Paenibacillus baekrokdamisoli]MBB3072443.1 histidyl-tRNA synthetase [Paenibacillus baekrokdamisoli]BBH20502.1 histidine--tRNA ligase 1 [Paenibacillus baekrokdamisoli]